MLKSLSKLLWAIAIIAICAVIAWLGYLFFYKKPLQKTVDLTKTTIVTQLVALNNLETAKMTLHKVVEGQQNLKDFFPSQTRDNTIQDFFFQNKLGVDAYAEVVAGFSLKNMQSGGITVNPDNTVTITLSEPIVLHARLTPETKPFVRKTGILTSSDMMLETEIRNQTLEKMTQEAIEKGLLDEAKNNATTALRTIIEPLGYTISTVNFETTATVSQ